MPSEGELVTTDITQAVLLIQSGPQAGQDIRVEPGKPVRFGRKNIADFALPDDTHMSSLHFIVEADEKGAVLRDLASRNGTKVNGRQVNAVQLTSGRESQYPWTNFSGGRSLKFCP